VPHTNRNLSASTPFLPPSSASPALFPCTHPPSLRSAIHPVPNSNQSISTQPCLVVNPLGHRSAVLDGAVIYISPSQQKLCDAFFCCASKGTDYAAPSKAPLASISQPLSLSANIHTPPQGELPAISTAGGSTAVPSISSIGASLRCANEHLAPFPNHRSHYSPRI
jgi:hypothetical protein